MTQLKTYRCDRCERDFSLPEGRRPARIVDDDESWGEKITYDLCDDCHVTFSFFLENVEQFDNLADKICAEETRDEEAKTG